MAKFGTWTKTADALPREGQEVIGAYENRVVCIRWVGESKRWSHIIDGWLVSTPDAPAYWMPMPGLPKEVQR